MPPPFPFRRYPCRWRVPRLVTPRRAFYPNALPASAAHTCCYCCRYASSYATITCCWMELVPALRTAFYPTVCHTTCHITLRTPARSCCHRFATFCMPLPLQNIGPRHHRRFPAAAGKGVNDSLLLSGYHHLPPRVTVLGLCQLTLYHLPLPAALYFLYFPRFLFGFVRVWFLQRACVPPYLLVSSLYRACLQRSRSWLVLISLPARCSPRLTSLPAFRHCPLLLFPANNFRDIPTPPACSFNGWDFCYRTFLLLPPCATAGATYPQPTALFVHLPYVSG